MAPEVFSGSYDEKCDIYRYLLVVHVPVCLGSRFVVQLRDRPVGNVYSSSCFRGEEEPNGDRIILLVLCATRLRCGALD
jgi:hypothetical protein